MKSCVSYWLWRNSEPRQPMSMWPRWVVSLMNSSKRIQAPFAKFRKRMRLSCSTRNCKLSSPASRISLRLLRPRSSVSRTQLLEWKPKRWLLLSRLKEVQSKGFKTCQGGNWKRWSPRRGWWIGRETTGAKSKKIWPNKQMAPKNKSEEIEKERL